jgi:hypothetical protein
VGTLPDGRVHLLGTQVPNTTARHRRDPLTLSLSRDGLAFDRVWALRSGAPEYRYPGGYTGKNYGFQYPNALVVGGSLWVVYSANKEDIELMAVPLVVLKTDDGDVTLFGAWPDDGQDDTAIIQKVLDGCADSRGRAFVPAGTYIISLPKYPNVTDTCLVIPSNCTLYGEGETSVLK